jgi:prophage tail gpP-like protein
MITSQVVSEIKFEVTGDILQPNIEKIDGKTQTISVVGRDSPPTIVDNAAVKPLVVEQQVTPEIDQNNQHSDKSKQKKPIKS